jgi:rSAM/selenodomain-associated transferase 2
MIVIVRSEILPLAVVVPTLNAEAGLEAALESIAGRVSRIVVADGGSTDATMALAKARGGDVFGTVRGRGQQMRAGADAALLRGECTWLLFLHADTRLQPGWVEAVRDHMALADSARLAGYFRLRLDDRSRAARRVERLVAWRCRRLGLPYGDQGLLIHRDLYREVGGFRAIPLMEDVDLARRIGRKRLLMLEADALTSAVRYRRDGFWLRPLRNLTLLGLYWLGVPPERLVRWYG